jgi:prolyl-tRNA synthetase
VELARRDLQDKTLVSIDGIAELISNELDEMQSRMFNRAQSFVDEMTTVVDTREEFEAAVLKGGFIRAHWDGTGETEESIKELTKATIRCIPYDAVPEEGVDPFSGKPSTRRVLFAKAY